MSATPAALTIDWAAHDGLTPREQYDAAGGIIDSAKAAAAARRARIAHDLAQQHDAKEAARILGISRARVYALAERYRDTQPVIADDFPGRSIARYDLLTEVEDQYGLSTREAHEAIHAHLQSLIDIDGEDEVVIARTPQRPELLKSNPNDLDVRMWLTVRAESVDEIREALAAQYADE
ncbi:helix-turn-helix domain-containing protein [Streptomyces asiaticus]